MYVAWATPQPPARAAPVLLAWGETESEALGRARLKARQRGVVVNERDRAGHYWSLLVEEYDDAMREVLRREGVVDA